ncbi:alternate-type signal peptide domain-containing protein [Rhodococcus sp. UNC363MFTsu5.1]|uniref:alternate-type signal peptide domain-containing protein n=1 Tax=Rhodococcus sp. UNC363MFTsu5.1 TaxID=1449069 RepID=UPI000480CFEC|nr:alternate-type signal peptide domain-containing protein [Rhodococcus sp. UNC363MFTsu5.1]
MNKQTKGAIAAGAAALLLAGGAGTMAAWNSSQTVGGGAVNSGTLSLSQGTPAGWTDSSGPIDITTFKAVPGDVVTYNASFVVGAKGKNLAATLKADPSSITGDADLKTALNPTVTATVDGTALPSNGSGAAITQAQDGKTVAVQVKFTFDSATAGTTAQGQAVNLANFNVTLTQNA